MSGLLDSIVRRRRASASSRLGPAAATGVPHANGAAPAENGDAHVNGTTAPPVIFHALQVARPEPAAVPAEAAEATALAPVEPEATQAAEVEPEPADAPDAEPEPEPTQAEQPDATDRPAFHQRGRIRRRANYLRALREVHLRDIGGFMVELHRFGRERPDLVKAKIEGAAQIDTELRALERALTTEQTIRELREAGIGGACENCGAVHGSGDRFCASCGKPLQASAAAAPEE